MERLSDILTRSGQRSRPPALLRAARSDARLSPLPVGSFLGGEDEEDEHQGEEQATTSHLGSQESRATERPRPRAGRRERTRVVDSVPSLPPAMIPRPLVATQPMCPRCKGAGYLRADVPFGHPLFGKPLPCACKQARVNEERRRLLREQSQIDRLAVFREASFETFHFLLPGVQEAYEVALQFAHEPQGWLILEGNNGCGKTHLAVSIAKHCLDEGAIVLFAVVPDLLDYLRTTFAPNAEEPYDEAFLKMREAELLVLDDLGAEHSTPWANEKLFQLLNYRYNARLATVITTNKIGLAGIENRIRSRLSDTRLVRVVTMGDAQDFRACAEPTEREDENP